MVSAAKTIDLISDGAVERGQMPADPRERSIPPLQHLPVYNKNVNLNLGARP